MQPVQVQQHATHSLPTTESTPIDKHPPLDFATADRLLEKLSCDDEFRAHFSDDWRAALAQVGYSDAYAASVKCGETRNLASKEEIAEAREALHAHLTSYKPMMMSWIFNFEAGHVRDSLSI